MRVLTMSYALCLKSGGMKDKPGGIGDNDKSNPNPRGICFN